MACARINNELARELIDSVTTVMFDCDGVLVKHVKDKGAIEGAAEFVQKLRDMGKKVVFVTNNSMISIRQFLDRFKKLGIIVKEEEFFGTPRVTAVYLKHVLKCDKKVYLIGSQGVAEELRNVGIESTPVCPYPLLGEATDEVTKRVDFTVDEKIGAVVVGFDEHISCQKITTAMMLLKNPEVHFIATTTDKVFPVGNGKLMPGGGVNVQAIQAASNRDPIIIGKPHQPMMDAVKAIHNIEPSKTLMIGDRLESDIAFGRRFGTKTLAVLSGLLTLQQLEKTRQDSSKSQIVPDFVAGSVKDLLDGLEGN